MLRRSKDEVLALPPKLRAWIPVEVPPGTGSRAVRKVFELLAGKHQRPAAPRDLELRKRGKLLAFLVEARQALAFAKTTATLDFVRGAVDQGQKVIVFSCFDDPIRRFAAELGPAAVVLTGKTPSDMRQQLVDRFQREDEVRVFVANIVAGGTGLNLTAATQVVFNDLDWVPTNHWQAEDRAYRIGQTRTVNVTYFVARDTIDDFVQAVLETKAALVNAIVEGEALAAGSGGDVLDELQRVLHSITDGAADAPDGSRTIGDRAAAAQRLRGASRDTPHRRAGPVAARSEREIEALARALQSLVRILAGPSVRRFRISSASHDGTEHEIVVMDADVTCSCPGSAIAASAVTRATSRPRSRLVPPCRRSTRKCGERPQPCRCRRTPAGECCSSGVSAGPARTLPSGRNREPWHGQSQVFSARSIRPGSPCACTPARPW
jgi:hypothetical protein